jgi:hypothetical protein
MQRTPVNRTLPFGSMTPGQQISTSVGNLTAAQLTVSQTQIALTTHDAAKPAVLQAEELKTWEAARTVLQEKAASANTELWAITSSFHTLDTSLLEQTNTESISSLYNEKDLRKEPVARVHDETIFSFTKILSERIVTFGKASVIRMLAIGKFGDDIAEQASHITETQWRSMIHDQEGKETACMYNVCMRAVYVSAFERGYAGLSSRFQNLSKKKGEKLTEFARRLSTYALQMPSIYQLYDSDEVTGVVETTKTEAAKVRTDTLKENLLTQLVKQYQPLRAHIIVSVQKDFEESTNKCRWITDFTTRVDSLTDQLSPEQSFHVDMASSVPEDRTRADRLLADQKQEDELWKARGRGQLAYHQVAYHQVRAAQEQEGTPQSGFDTSMYSAANNQKLGPPPVPGQAPPPPNCRFWSSGKCRAAAAGTACQFTHTGQAPPQQPPPAPHDNQEPCRQFAAGRCKRGEKCKYSHSQATSYAPHRGQNPPRPGPYDHPSPRKGTCFDHQRGACSRGDRCKFSHQGGPAQPQQGGGGAGRNPNEGDKKTRERQRAFASEQKAMGSNISSIGAQVAMLVQQQTAQTDAANKAQANIDQQRQMTQMFAQFQRQQQTGDKGEQQGFYLGGPQSGNV